MKRTIFLLLLIGAAFGGSVTGNVTRLMDLFPFPMPAEGVTVRLENMEDEDDFVEAVTNPEGNYTITTSSTGFFTLTCPDESTTPSAHSVTFETGSESYTGYDFEIRSGSSTGGALIGGKVSYHDGAPAEGTTVIITRPDAPIPLPVMATTNAAGEYEASIDGDENVEITCMAMPPYMASPEMYSEFIAAGDTNMTFDFVLTDDSPIGYQISFQGTIEGGMTTDFQAFWRHEDDSVETSMPVTMDTPPISVPDSGNYYCRAEKPGYRADPPTQTVHLGRMMPMGMAVFTFTDTSDAPDYLITCRANDGIMPVMEYNVRWRAEGATSWITESPTPFGSVEIRPGGPGIYELTAVAAGMTFYPEIATVELTEADPTDSVTFTTDDDSTTTENWFTVHVVDEEGEPVEGLEIDYENPIEPDASGTLITDADGYATYYVSLFGNFNITPRPEPGYWTVPEEASVLIAPFLTPVDTVEFELREGEVFYYTVTVSAINDDDEIVTSSYLIQHNTPDDTTWRNRLSDGSGYTTFEFEDPGSYDFKITSLGGTVEPEILTAMLTEGDPEDSLQFRITDSTGTEDPFILVLRSVTPEGDPFPELTVDWNRSFSDDSGSVSTGTEGEITLEFDAMGYYNFIAMPEVGYFTIPEEASRLLSSATALDTVVFEVHEGSAGSYIITVVALDEEGEIATGYRINWRQPAEDSSWTMAWADGSGYTDFEFDFPGDFEIRPDMYGLMFEPEMGYVSLTEASPVDTVWFEMIDTSGITDDFSITVISEDEDDFPFPDLEFTIESALDTIVDTLSTGFEGEITEYFTRSDYYTITAIAPDGYYVEPEEESVLLSMLNRADTVRFTVIEGEPPVPYWVTIFATDSSETPQFGTSMAIDEETAMTGFGGYASIYVDGPGDYDVSAYVEDIPGFDFVVVPDEFTVTLTESHTADTTHVYVTNVESVRETPALPNDFTISAYPNPFNASCFIDVPQGTDVAIFDTKGNLVKCAEGSFIWYPEGLPSGVYSVIARQRDNSISRNLLFIK